MSDTEMPLQSEVELSDSDFICIGSPKRAQVELVDQQLVDSLESEDDHSSSSSCPVLVTNSETKVEQSEDSDNSVAASASCEKIEAANPSQDTDLMNLESQHEVLASEDHTPIIITDDLGNDAPQNDAENFLFPACQDDPSLEVLKNVTKAQGDGGTSWVPLDLYVKDPVLSIEKPAEKQKKRKATRKVFSLPKPWSLGEFGLIVVASLMLAFISTGVLYYQRSVQPKVYLLSWRSVGIRQEVEGLLFSDSLFEHEDLKALKPIELPGRIESVQIRTLLPTTEVRRERKRSGIPRIVLSSKLNERVVPKSTGSWNFYIMSDSRELFCQCKAEDRDKGILHCACEPPSREIPTFASTLPCFPKPKKKKPRALPETLVEGLVFSKESAYWEDLGKAVKRFGKRAARRFRIFFVRLRVTIENAYEFLIAQDPLTKLGGHTQAFANYWEGLKHSSKKDFKNLSKVTIRAASKAGKWSYTKANCIADKVRSSFKSKRASRV